MDEKVIFNTPVSSPAFSSGDNLLTPQIVDLIKQYREGLEEQRKGSIVPIHVDEIASKVARFYEKVRKVVDWKEENVLRRSAIVRILKRSLISKISQITLDLNIDVEKLAESLTVELIRSGHLPNDEVAKEKITLVVKALRKYLYILENAPFNKNKLSLVFKEKINFYDWILEIAACEIEEILALPFKENALIKAMTLLIDERTQVVPSDTLSKDEKRTLVYIAVCRTLFDLDEAFIAYHIFTHRYAEWNSPTPELMQKITQEVFLIDRSIRKELEHPLGREFFNVCERIDTVFTLLGDLLDYYQKEPEKINQAIEDKSRLKELITDFYNKRLKTLKARLFRIAVFSTLSVFVSNWFSFFIVEVPLAHLFYQGFNFVAALVDFLVPSLMMFILVAMIKPPGQGNLEKVTETVFNFVYQDQRKDIYEVKLEKKRHSLVSLIIGLLYLVGTLLSFGFIAWVFRLAQIPTTSVIMDTAMIALNVSAALVVRNKARELTIQEKTTFGEFVLDILSVPVAEVGNRLANKWKEYNLVSVFFNLAVDMPLLATVEFVENWSQFIRRKKADIH